MYNNWKNCSAPASMQEDSDSLRLALDNVFSLIAHECCLAGSHKRHNSHRTSRSGTLYCIQLGIVQLAYGLVAGDGGAAVRDGPSPLGRDGAYCDVTCQLCSQLGTGWSIYSI